MNPVTPLTARIKPSVSVLKNIRLLKVFSDQELSSLIQHGEGMACEAYNNIVIEGEMTWGLYLILDGMVGVYKRNKLTGVDYDVGQLRTGNFFGEMSLVDEYPRSATVRALSDCQLFSITKEGFQQFLSKNPSSKSKFFESCVETLVHRLRELDENYVISQYQLWKTALKKEAA
ncbi:cyclic nucleotide-binding domain-containing protein [Bdellovibrionota bacterium FG-2]